MAVRNRSYELQKQKSQLFIAILSVWLNNLKYVKRRKSFFKIKPFLPPILVIFGIYCPRRPHNSTPFPPPRPPAMPVVGILLGYAVSS